MHYAITDLYLSSIRNKTALLFHENSKFDIVKEKIEKHSTEQLLEEHLTTVFPISKLQTMTRENSTASVWHLVDPTHIFSQQYGKNFISRESAHAQIKHQDSSTSGRGARASYRTMFPEISAR